MSVPGIYGAAEVAAPPPVRRGRRRGGAWRWPVLLILGIYFVVPIAASVWYSIRTPGGGVTARAYTGIPGAQGFGDAFTRSLLLALLTVVLVLVLMVPTVVLVELRLPRLRTTVELLTLLPLVLPPIALVVGVRIVLEWAPDYFLNTPIASVMFALQDPGLPWILVLVYGVLALPFVYRALDAGVRGVDLRTLTEAARGLGASWSRVLVSVVLPALRTSVLNAAFLTVALVLGEFTVASILGFTTFPTWIVQTAGNEPQLSVSVSILSLAVTWALLLLISALDRRRPVEEDS